MTATPVIVSAPAKVNLYLAVGPIRSDGYHAVSTVLQALELADELTVSPSARLSLSCDPPLAIPAEENLVYRAAVALGETVGTDPGFSFRLTKRIPAGAGLGGGSADAAAALMGMANLLGLQADDPRLARVARALGADVAFFLAGGTALYGGRGERLIRPLPTVDVDVAVIMPAEPITTVGAYEMFDRLASQRSPGVSRVTEALRFQDKAALGAAIHNNMTDAASALVAAVPEAIALCQGVEGVLGAALCGSGSAVFALCGDAEAAAHVVSQAAARGWWGSATRTNPRGVVARTGEVT